MNSQDARPENLRAVDIPALVVFAALLVVVFLQFFSRYVLNDSFGWTEEIARYLLIVTAYLGSISALRKGEHIFLEFVYRKAPAGNARPLALFAESLGVVYHAGLTVLALLLALSTDQRMVSVDAPKSIVYSVVAAALAVATWFSLRRLLLRWHQTEAQVLADIEHSTMRESQP